MRGRGLIALLSVVLLVVAAGMAYYLFYPTDSARKSGVNQALVSFDKEMKQAAGYPRHSGAAIPPFGVYRYSTRGSEEIESTAFSTGHRYGAVTGITLTPTRCGVKERWQPLVQSWTEGELCYWVQIRYGQRGQQCQGGRAGGDQAWPQHVRLALQTRP